MDTKDEAEPVNQARARETCHGGNTRFLTTEPWPVCFPLQGCWCWRRKCRGQGLWCSSREQPSFPWVGEGPWSLSFTLYSWDVWSWNEGPQTTLVFHFMSYPVIQDSPTKAAIDTHTVGQPAWPTVLAMIPMELLPGVAEGSWKPEIAAVASAKGHKSWNSAAPRVADWVEP